MADVEASTRKLLRTALGHDFFVYEGWAGRESHKGASVKYDLVLAPRPHLIAKGFENGHVIVEVKLFNADDKKKHDVKARDLLWQCISYSFSDVFLPDGASERPLFVLYFIAGSGIDPKHKDDLKMLHHFVQRGGVGKLALNETGEWSMIFGGSYYFRSSTGKGPLNVGTKRQLGSSR